MMITEDSGLNWCGMGMTEGLWAVKYRDHVSAYRGVQTGPCSGPFGEACRVQIKFNLGEKKTKTHFWPWVQANFT